MIIIIKIILLNNNFRISFHFFFIYTKKIKINVSKKKNQKINKSLKKHKKKLSIYIIY